MTTATRNLKDHFRGCMVGMAIGDALGAASEFMTEQHVRSRFGVLNPVLAAADGLHELAMQ